ncbi:FAD-dependent oxidoreductase, partial [Listeria monocytogenes]|uniref:FAD-dependent oxidoreductase n=1 Tax=Listeria monocytogenes TaxID=1639 RepID=UPI003FA45AB9
VKGSHIVVRRRYPGDHAYLFQNHDKRVIFAIPYETDFTLIGTTDVPHDGPPGPVTISDAETDYLCDAANRWLAEPIAPGDVVWS